MIEISVTDHCYFCALYIINPMWHDSHPDASLELQQVRMFSDETCITPFTPSSGSVAVKPITADTSCTPLSPTVVHCNSCLAAQCFSSLIDFLRLWTCCLSLQLKCLVTHFSQG